MKKRFLNLFLALALVVCVLPFAASAVKYAGDTCESFTGQHDWEDGYCGWCALPCNHNYDANGECTKCDVVCKHAAYENGFCTVCGVECDHSYDTNGECTKCGVVAVCDHAAYENGFCTACGAECDHKYENKGYAEGFEATCQHPGYFIFECSACGKRTRGDAPQLSHSPVDIAEVPATCAKAGTTAGKQCSVCEEILEGVETIPATGKHEYQLEEKIKAPTCTEKGTNRERCKNCTASQLVYPKALGHTPADVAEVPATCAKTGTTAGKQCSVCEEILEGVEIIPATGKHEYQLEEQIKAPTCTEKGTNRERCKNCTASQLVYPKALGHTPADVAEVPATCVKTGTTAGKQCSVCEEILEGVEIIPATGKHEYQFEEQVKAPTCTEKGTNRERCKNCTAAQLVYPKALGHTPADVAEVPATCAKTGTTAGKQCSVCEEILEGVEIIPATGKHNYDNYEGPIEGEGPTCVEAGKGKFRCTTCNKWAKKPVDKLGHIDVIIEVVREPSCTVYGVTKYGCEREGCGQTWFVEAESLGHKNEILDAVEPTCTATGLTEGVKCSVCNEVLTAQQEIRKAEHNWKTIEAKEANCAEDGHNAYQECETCGTTQNKEIIKGGHKFENFKCTACGIRDTACEHKNAKITVTESTCTVAGSKNFKCEDCGYEFEETLALKEHTEVDKSYAATCTKKGLTHKVCSACGKDLVKQEIATIAHNYVNNVCSGCGAAQAHSCRNYRRNTVTVKEANCTETGLQHVVCSKCGYVFETKVTAPAHKATTTMIREPATCTKAGEKHTVCTGCGTVTKIEEIRKLDHSYLNGVCSGCNQGDPNKVTTDFQDIFGVF